jgi:alpha-beta hydrolase superfamily lysophospholipase
MSTTKETILFVHGAWHGKWCWEKYFRTAFEKQGYHVVTFDLPGHNQSGKIKGINKYSLHDYVKSLEAEVLKIDEPLIIVGHSMGGLIVQKYLEKKDCKKAILLASVPPYGVINTTLNFAKKLYFYSALLSLDLYRLVNSEEKCRTSFFSKQIEAADLKEYTAKLCSESFKAFLGMLLPRVKVRKNLGIPILVLGAENDTIFSISDHKKTAEKYDADLFIIPNIAHDMMLDQNQEKVSAKMLAWLNDEIQSAEVA